jgi:hypothetical protein
MRFTAPTSSEKAAVVDKARSGDAGTKGAGEVGRDV